MGNFHLNCLVSHHPVVQIKRTFLSASNDRLVDFYVLFNRTWSGSLMTFIWGQEVLFLKILVWIPCWEVNLLGVKSLTVLTMDCIFLWKQAWVSNVKVIHRSLNLSGKSFIQPVIYRFSFAWIYDISYQFFDSFVASRHLGILHWVVCLHDLFSNKFFG